MPRPLKPLDPNASWSALFGATVQQLRLALRDHPRVSQDELGKRIGFDGSTVSAVERAALRPDRQFVSACERELAAAGMLDAIAPFVYDEWKNQVRPGSMTVSRPTPAEIITNQRELDLRRLPELIEKAKNDPLDGVAEVMELARQAEASAIGSSTVETVERAAHRLARDYPKTAPSLLIPQVQQRLRLVTQLLNGKLTLAQHRDLLVAGGWLTALLSNLQFDVGNREAAELTRDTVYQLGKEAGHQELMAWSFEFLAWFALVEGRYRDTIEQARTGLAIAPGSSAGVQLAVQEAKGWARLGDRREAERAMRDGARALDALPSPAHPDHHFVFDPTKYSFYAATIYTWLQQADQAEEHAQEVICQTEKTLDGKGWPTRLSIAKLDLGLIASQRDQPDEAAALGIQALNAGRVVPSTIGWFADLDEALKHHRSQITEVEDFHDRYATAGRE